MCTIGGQLYGHPFKLSVPGPVLEDRSAFLNRDILFVVGHKKSPTHFSPKKSTLINECEL
jgi:hypothetical protein